MSSLKESFEELRLQIGHGAGFNHATDDPVYYLVFHPKEMLEVKRRFKQWAAQLKLDDWTVHVLSMADTVHEIFQHNDLRDIWLMSEKEDPFDFDAINSTLSESLTAGDELKNRLQTKLASLSAANKDILFITDLEALHPYVRVGTLEQKLQGRFTVPTVILYPGIRAGRTSLRFLGIYPEDGNYRSTHIGG